MCVCGPRLSEDSHLQQPHSLNTNKESSVQGYSGVSTDVWSRDLDT